MTLPDALTAYKASRGHTGMPWEIHEEEIDAIFTAGWEAARNDGAIQAAANELFPSDPMAGRFVEHPPVPAITAEDIYAAWPVKKARGAAIAAIKKAMKKENPAELLNAVKELAGAFKAWPSDERQYLPMCSTFMNQERWADDRATWRKGATTISQFSKQAH